MHFKSNFPRHWSSIHQHYFYFIINTLLLRTNNETLLNAEQLLKTCWILNWSSINSDGFILQDDGWVSHTRRERVCVGGGGGGCWVKSSSYSSSKHTRLSLSRETSVRAPWNTHTHTLNHHSAWNTHTHTHTHTHWIITVPETHTHTHTHTESSQCLKHTHTHTHWIITVPETHTHTHWIITVPETHTTHTHWIITVPETHTHTHWIITVPETHTHTTHTESSQCLKHTHTHTHTHTLNHHSAWNTHNTTHTHWIITVPETHTHTHTHTHTLNHHCLKHTHTHWIITVPENTHTHTESSQRLKHTQTNTHTLNHHRSSTTLMCVITAGTDPGEDGEEGAGDGGPRRVSTWLQGLSSALASCHWLTKKQKPTNQTKHQNAGTDRHRHTETERQSLERIIGVHLPSLQDLYYSRVKKRAGIIITDPSHPGHDLFVRLPSGRRYRQGVNYGGARLPLIRHGLP